jgi:phosphonate transport system permease protein
MTDAARIAEIEAYAARRETLRAYMWLAGLAVAAALIYGAAAMTDFSIQRLLDGLPRTVGFFEQAAPDLRAPVLFEGEKTEGSFLYWFYAWDKWAGLVWQSVEMAILATVMAVAVAFPLSFMAAKTTTAHPALMFVTRRFFELLRTIPDIVLALIFVFAFGIGPLAGVLAIAIHATGALGKLFAEAIENVDEKPLEGVRAAGGGLIEAIRFGATPQVLPNMESYALLRFEINVGSAAAIGFVGAGGIGQEFTAAINFAQFQDAAAIMLMTVLVIFVIDLASEALRHRLMGVKA